MSDPQSEILVALMRGPRRGMSLGELGDVTGRASSTIRNNVNVLMSRNHFIYPPVEQVPGSRDESKRKPRLFRLTARGRELARFRARQK